MALQVLLLWFSILKHSKLRTNLAYPLGTNYKIGLTES